MQGVAFKLIFLSVGAQQVSAALPCPRALCFLTGISNIRAMSCLGRLLGQEILLQEEPPFLC